MEKIIRIALLIPAAVLGLTGLVFAILTVIYGFLWAQNWITGSIDYLSYGTVGWEIWQRFGFDVTGYAPGHPAWHPIIGAIFDSERTIVAGLVAAVSYILARAFCRISAVFAPEPE